jgi:hypothetical protein
LILFFLLGLVLFLSAFLILIPLWLNNKSGEKERQGTGLIFQYFIFIGIGFMFLEIPLISQWGLFLREPVYTFTLIVSIMLLSSGLGSRAAESGWVEKEVTVPALFFFGGGFILFSVLEKNLILAWPVWFRVLMAVLGLAPLGFSLGTFFPRGLSWVKESHPDLVPWAWAVNGTASVIASVLAAIFSLEWGFPVVLLLGVVLYAGAWSVWRRMAS